MAPGPIRSGAADQSDASHGTGVARTRRRGRHGPGESLAPLPAQYRASLGAVASALAT
jgi:hypothetical protein